MNQATARVSARSTTLDFSQKYGSGYCIPTWLRDEQVKIATRKVRDRVQQFDGKRTEPIAVVGFGPSLKKTWEELKNFKYIITSSGAHRFLLDRGIVPTWHLSVDPRDHQTALLGGKTHPEVTYLPCSTCHPRYINHLIEEGAKVELWHCFSNEAEALRILPPGEYALTGGMDAGLRSMAMARFFGFVDLHVFGVDGSSEDDKQHAGEHPNSITKFFDVEFGGKTFRTAPNLMEVAKTVPHEVDMLKLDKIKFYGEGLVQEMMRKHVLKSPKNSNIAFVKPVLITDDHKARQIKRHETQAEYGANGSKHATTIQSLCENLKTTSVLDYGCGKGTLALNMPFPIWEYDPAIKGRDEQPRPADIVVCTEVLEFVEVAKLNDVLANLASLMKKVGYVSITQNGSIRQDEKWWTKILSRYFEIGSCTKTEEIQFVLGPKKHVQAQTGEIQTVERNGKTAQFHVPNDTVAWRVNTLFEKEKCTVDWIESFAPGEVLYDIGANMGGYTVWASKQGVKVYAFEPEAQNYALLCKNLTLNKVEGSGYCLALSDKPSLSTIYLTSQAPGGSCNSLGEKVGPDLQPREGIPQGAFGYTLDMLAKELPQPDHIKIDVDGFEHKVINGGLEVLKNAKSLLVEVNTNLEEHQEMLKTLTEMGFKFDQKQVDDSIRKEGPFEGCAEYVFRKTNEKEQALLDAIEKAEVIQEPFPHLVLEGVDLGMNLPDGEAYGSLEETRGTSGYEKRRTAKLPSEVSWIKSGQFCRALERKFNVKSRSEEAFLLRDKTGYLINPHTDTPTKSLTALFYLNDSEQGTSLYKHNDESFKSMDGRHLRRKDFNLVKTIPFKAGTMIAFARTNTSFHGVEKFEGAQRDLLCWCAKR